MIDRLKEKHRATGKKREREREERKKRLQYNVIILPILEPYIHILTGNDKIKSKIVVYRLI